MLADDEQMIPNWRQSRSSPEIFDQAIFKHMRKRYTYFNLSNSFF